MERKKNETLGRPVLSKMVFLVEQVQVLVHVPKPLLLPEMVLLVELVPVSEQVSVSKPDPLADQTDPLTQ